MKLAHFVIGIGNQEHVELCKTGQIFITVTEYDQARINELMQEAATQLDAMPEPTKEPAEPIEAYEGIRDRYIREYEASPEGQKFVKRLANMEKEWEKYGKHSDIRAAEYVYLNDKYSGSFFNGGYDMYKLGFVAGRRKHIAEMKKKAKQK